jgi:hypothetical protein
LWEKLRILPFSIFLSEAATDGDETFVGIAGLSACFELVLVDFDFVADFLADHLKLAIRKEYTLKH